MNPGGLSSKRCRISWDSSSTHHPSSLERTLHNTRLFLRKPFPPRLPQRDDNTHLSRRRLARQLTPIHSTRQLPPSTHPRLIITRREHRLRYHTPFDSSCSIRFFFPLPNRHLSRKAPESLTAQILDSPSCNHFSRFALYPSLPRALRIHLHLHRPFFQASSTNRPLSQQI